MEIYRLISTVVVSVLKLVFKQHSAFAVVLFSFIVAGLQSFPAVSCLFDASVHPGFVAFFVDFLKQFTHFSFSDRLSGR